MPIYVAIGEYIFWLWPSAYYVSRIKLNGSEYHERWLEWGDRRILWMMTDGEYLHLPNNKGRQIIIGKPEFIGRVKYDGSESNASQISVP